MTCVQDYRPVAGDVSTMRAVGGMASDGGRGAEVGPGARRPTRSRQAHPPPMSPFLETGHSIFARTHDRDPGGYGSPRDGSGAASPRVLPGSGGDTPSGPPLA